MCHIFVIFYPFICVISTVKFIDVLKEYLHIFVIFSSSMEVFNYPDRLSNLAVEAFGKCVSQLLVQLVRYQLYTDTTSMKQNYVQEACGQLQEMILRTVPPLLANDVTIKLLRHLDRSYHKLCKTERDSCVEEVASEILSAIIHPDVMRLECSEINSHPTLTDHYKPRASKFIYLALPRLKDLKVLKLGWALNNSKCKYSLTYIPEKLERFSSWDCSDKDVELLSISCKQLVSLDLTNSFRVSNVSLPFLTKFQYLKELNVSGTRISENGLTELLTALTKTEVPGNDYPVCLSLLLKSFGCDNPLKDHIDLLVNNFQNLTSLSLRNVQTFSVTRLNRLTHLRNFTITYMPLNLAGEILQVIGFQLKYLDITVRTVSDLKSICDYCPLLHCLHISFHRGLCHQSESTIMTYFERVPLPVFHSVQCLQLVFYKPGVVEYILSRFVNCERLYIVHDGCEALFQNILHRKQLKNLQQFYWGNHTVVEFSGEQAIITRFNEERISVHSAQIQVS
jgi:hypothetical protein